MKIGPLNMRKGAQFCQIILQPKATSTTLMGWFQKLHLILETVRTCRSFNSIISLKRYVSNYQQMSLFLRSNLTIKSHLKSSKINNFQLTETWRHFAQPFGFFVINAKFDHNHWRAANSPIYRTFQFSASQLNSQCRSLRLL